MYSYLKILFLILVIFIIGVAIGARYHPLIHMILEKIWNKTEEPVTESLHFCPPPKIVKEHQYSPEAFQVEQLYWQMDYQGWQAPDGVGFMQALINADNNLVCYYQWPNPKEKGTYLWMTIRLSPSVNQLVKPYGSYWTIQKKEKQALCRSGINACGFILSENSKRIIPQK
ncbi:hypothetical protein LEAN103870_15690 [Legionella anisa]|uniref:Uncharacterized protein n=1 Tax=Legionella anisa TaxID=28082 RepID=A0AAX0WWS4_9GAMM|nr:hypothetical protein [Legionella anisa]AWN73383.1 hypothetical protein DLD14_05740 [Legionella anisa]KTC70494.1 hypothetical protein Lani_2041 [Legionella anisa]MBN5934167.1 hypothetical protein [Legionella anisa]MCW8426247.1 hypothetical protein [Legionella anisa]MCW8447909.1 hypothetical protein [Legionella anisa]